jgi:nucleoside-diphosphate-sugar epimerase
MKFAFPNPTRLAQIVREVDPSFVVNLVSIVNAERNLELFGELIRTNVNVLLELYGALNGRPNLRLFVQFGSAEEYGPITTPFEERNREAPNSPYAIVKQATTNAALMLHKNFGFPAVVVRPGNIFGRYQPVEKLIPYVIAQFKRNETIRLTPGEQKRDFIYAPDLAEPLHGLMKAFTRSRGLVVNVSYGEGVTIRSVVEHIAKRLSSRSLIEFGALPYREGEMMDFSCDIRRLNDLTGWFPHKSVFEALDEYLRDEGERVV